jgi:hypothetical protein
MARQNQVLSDAASSGGGLRRGGVCGWYIVDTSCGPWVSVVGALEFWRPSDLESREKALYRGLRCWINFFLIEDAF